MSLPRDNYLQEGKSKPRKLEDKNPPKSFQLNWDTSDESSPKQTLPSFQLF
jgi:hypothetical protein